MTWPEFYARFRSVRGVSLTLYGEEAEAFLALTRAEPLPEQNERRARLHWIVPGYGVFRVRVWLKTKAAADLEWREGEARRARKRRLASE